MISREMSDSAILRELGDRLRRLRLDRNITQQDLADRAGLSRPTISEMETSGRCTLPTLLRALRVLERLEDLESFLPAAQPSPLELARRRGHVRQRASGSPAPPPDDDPIDEGGESSW